VTGRLRSAASTVLIGDREGAWESSRGAVCQASVASGGGTPHDQVRALASCGRCRRRPSGGAIGQALGIGAEQSVGHHPPVADRAQRPTRALAWIGAGPCESRAAGVSRVRVVAHERVLVSVEGDAVLGLHEISGKDVEAMVIAGDTVLSKHTKLAVDDPPDLHAFQPAGCAQHAHPPRRTAGWIGNAQREQLRGSGHRDAEPGLRITIHKAPAWRLIRPAREHPRCSQRGGGKPKQCQHHRDDAPPLARAQPTIRPPAINQRRVKHAPERLLTPGVVHNRCRVTHRIGLSNQLNRNWLHPQLLSVIGSDSPGRISRPGAR
jgi:hypothetical protein